MAQRAHSFPKIYTDFMQPNQTLSADSLILIRHALDQRYAYLKDLHWNAVAFGATNPFIRNVAEEQGLIDKAREELGKTYEAQFPPQP